MDADADAVAYMYGIHHNTGNDYLCFYITHIHILTISDPAHPALAFTTDTSR